MTYRVVLYRDGREIETLYWSGSLAETIRLGRSLASEIEADLFQIIESMDNGATVYSQTVPPLFDGDAR